MPPTATKPKIDIDRLSPEEKAQLLAELEGERATKSQEIVGKRNEAMKTLMADRDHMRECPTGRTEMYSATRPANPAKGLGPKEVTVVRCQECGGTSVLDESYESAIARLEAKLEDEEVEV